MRPIAYGRRKADRMPERAFLQARLGMDTPHHNAHATPKTGQVTRYHCIIEPSSTQSSKDIFR